MQPLTALALVLLLDVISCGGCGSPQRPPEPIPEEQLQPSPRAPADDAPDEDPPNEAPKPASADQ